MVYTLRFFSSKCSLFHNSNEYGSCIIHILYTRCAKIKKKIIPAPKGKDAAKSRHGGERPSNLQHNSCSAGQEIPQFRQITTFVTVAHKCLNDAIFRTHNFIAYSFKVLFNIILPRPVYSQALRRFTYSDQYFVHF